MQISHLTVVVDAMKVKAEEDAALIDELLKVRSDDDGR
jgi:hypothetical protein